MKIFQNLGHGEWVSGQCVNYEDECIKHIF